MKMNPILVRGSRFGMAFLMLLNFHSTTAWAEDFNDAGLLPIEKSNVNKSFIDELFNRDSTNRNNRIRNSNNTTISTNNLQPVKASNVNDDFKCNLFESVPYEDIVSAINSLNQAVNTPACSGSSQVNVSSIVDNNKKIVEAVTQLRGYVENPDTVQAENAADISNKVDLAIRAISTVASSFAQTDLMKKECREAMNAGQIASSINDVVNGLTPYALMAATLTTGGAAAIPYIVGGSVVTGALSSMTKIIDENGVKVNQPEVRRAIVENTCQFIRLDQKYKFLIKSRQEQISRITSEISSSQRLFSAKVNALSGNTNGLVERKNALDKASELINATMSNSRSQLELDKQFVNSTSDDIKKCQLGIQWSVLAQDKNSYVSNMLASLDTALVAYGSNNVAQAQALKASGTLAMKNLQKVATKQFSGSVNFKACAEDTKSFIETVDQSASLAKQLVKLAQENIEKGMKSNKEYSLYKSRLSTLNQKQYQAQRVTDSLDKLQSYANTITQSEINSEMDRLRRGLFGNSYMGMSSSPILKWFNYVIGLHKADVSRFQEGLTSLRARAFQMSPSGQSLATNATNNNKLTGDMLVKDGKAAQNLVQFNLKNLPLGTADHDDVCREMQDIWGRWSSSIDHLAAVDAFCNMLEPYIYDNRSEDQNLVTMCRGYSKSSPKAVYGQPILSNVANMKNNLVKNNIRDWALFLQKKMSDLVCLENNGSLD